MKLENITLSERSVIKNNILYNSTYVNVQDIEFYREKSKLMVVSGWGS